MQNVQTPNTPSRSYAALPPLSRMYTTPSQRPSTSGGEAIEPSSTLLRRALLERRRSPMRPQSTTPRKAKNSLRSTSYMDPWMPSDGEEEDVRPRLTRSQTSRPARRRRATDLGNVRPAIPPSPPASPSPGVGLKVEQQGIDRLKKENWDLKHRIALQQQHATKLHTDLEQALSELARSRDLRERNTTLEKERDRLRQKCEHAEKQNTFLEAELKSLDEEVSISMDQKDGEIKDRQLAIEEAAGIIQRLEQENHNLQEALRQQQQQQQSIQTPLAHAGSDYYSGESDHHATVAAPSKPNVTPLTLTHDSDYFSADTSPDLSIPAPRRPQPLNQVKPSVADEVKRANTRKSAAGFDRQVGLKSLASRDSLLFKYVEDGTPKRTATIQTLRHRASRFSSSVARIPSPMRDDLSSSWSSISRPLRELYQHGELGRQVDDLTPSKPRSFSPSTQASVSEMSRSISSDDRSEIFSQADSITTRASSSATTRSVETITGATLKGSTSSLPLETKYQTHKVLPTPSKIALPASSPTAPSTRTPVNYVVWPRRYPEWPPSAGLIHRDMLYHDNDDGIGIKTEKSISPTYSRYSEDDSVVGLTNRSVTWKSTLPRRSDTSLATMPHRMGMMGFDDIPQDKLPESFKAKSRTRTNTLAGVGKLSRSLQGSLHGVREVLSGYGAEVR